MTTNAKATTTEIETKAGRWKIRETAHGGLEVEFCSDWPLGGFVATEQNYDKDTVYLEPRRRGPSCSGGG